MAGTSSRSLRAAAFFCIFATMKTLIIYGSQYGSTKRYAERLSEITGIEAVDYKKAKGIEGFDRIIFMGGLYAGGVLGLKKTVGKMTDNHFSGSSWFHAPSI